MASKTTSHHPLKGKYVVLLGRFSKAWPLREIAATLQEHEAILKRAITGKTDWVVCGTRPGEAKLARAKSYGVKVLSLEELRQLLAGESLEEVTPAPTEESEFDELLAEVRGILSSQEESHQTWLKLCKAIDQAPTSQVLLDYIKENIAAWSELPYTSDVGDSLSRSKAELPFLHPPYDVKQPPPSWIEAMMRQEDHPKYQLATNLNLFACKLDADALTRLLPLKHLQSIQSLCLAGNKLSVDFFKGWAEQQAFPALRCLILSYTKLRPAMLKALGQATHLPHLTHLNLANASPAYPASNFTPKHMSALVRASALAGITHLNLENNGLTPDHLDPLLSASHWTQLRMLDLDNNRFGPAGLSKLSQCPWLPQLEILRLQMTYLRGDDCLSPLQDAPMHALRELYLGHNWITRVALETLLSNPSLQKLEQLSIKGDLGHTEEDFLLATCESPVAEKLHTLDISGRYCPPAGIESLIADKHMPSLRSLRLGYCDADQLPALFASPLVARLEDFSLWPAWGTGAEDIQRRRTQAYQALQESDLAPALRAPLLAILQK